MKSKRLVIFGIGRFAELVKMYFAKYTEYEPIAFCLDKAYIEQDVFSGMPVVAFEDMDTLYPPDEYEMFVSFGYKNCNQLRAQKYYAAKEKGYKLATFVSPHLIRIEEDGPIGENTFIFEGQVIQPGVTIGNNVVLWSGNHIGHDVTIEDHCFITSHVVISGHTRIGEYSFIGVNATLRNEITIGKSNIIGAGCSILKSTGDNEVFIDKATEKCKLDTQAFVAKAKI